jgi:hypothetical protein
LARRLRFLPLSFFPPEMERDTILGLADSVLALLLLYVVVSSLSGWIGAVGVDSVGFEHFPS